MFEKLIKKIGKTLKEASIPYMIIGGQAILLYGEPRLTKDIDITLGVGVEKWREIFELAQKMGLKPILENIEDFVKRTFVLPTRDKITNIRVDFIFSYTPYERQAIERAKKITINGFPVNFASKEDVIIHKIFSGRARDIEDIKSIILKNPKINFGYIKKWLKEFDKATKGGFLKLFKKILKEIK